MAKRRKSKGKGKQVMKYNNNSAFKSFDQSAKMFFTKINCPDIYADLTKYERKLMFQLRLIVRNPEAALSYTIPSKELKKIGSAIHFKIRNEVHRHDEAKATAYDIDILRCFYSMISNKSVSLSRRQEFKDRYPFTNIGGGTIFSYVSISAINAVMAFCDIQTHIYGIDIRVAKIIKDNLEFELCFSLSKHFAYCKHISIQGVYRPVYAVGFPQYGLQVKWLKVEVSFLKGVYSGQNKNLAVYMQSHAKKRLTERLDLLDPSSIYYTLFDNTIDMDKFIFYKGYILYPYHLHDCKVGYLVADIIDDLLVFKTFLFITHTSTPEGDKLKEISGLAWKDISYWKIDRLSTFMKTNTEKYPGLTAMFKEAGLEDLFQLKGLDLDTLQDANLDALRDYIMQGKQEMSMEFV